VGYTLADYRRAGEALWGEAGAYAVDEYQRHNENYFSGELPPIPIVIGITAYGKCLGMTRGGGLPRITLSSSIFARTEHSHGRKRVWPHGRNVVSDTLLHEMIHAKLILEGRESAHNAQPWCDEITRLSPAVLGHEIQVAPVKPRRVNGKVRRHVLEGHLTQGELARWPYYLRPAGWDPGKPIPVDTY
jgi:hypothetical protein